MNKTFLWISSVILALAMSAGAIADPPSVPGSAPKTNDKVPMPSKPATTERYPNAIDDSRPTTLESTPTTMPVDSTPSIHRPLPPPTDGKTIKAPPLQ